MQSRRDTAAAKQFMRKLFKRWGLPRVPTGVGQGVALPHARLDNLDHAKGLFIRLERPLDFGSTDRQPVDLIFGLLAPADTGIDHLKALASVSRTFRNADLRTKLRANCDPLTLHAILTEPGSRPA